MHFLDLVLNILWYIQGFLTVGTLKNMNELCNSAYNIKNLHLNKRIFFGRT